MSIERDCTAGAAPHRTRRPRVSAVGGAIVRRDVGGQQGGLEVVAEPGDVLARASTASRPRACGGPPGWPGSTPGRRPPRPAVAGRPARRSRSPAGSSTGAVAAGAARTGAGRARDHDRGRAQHVVERPGPLQLVADHGGELGDPRPAGSARGAVRRDPARRGRCAGPRCRPRPPSPPRAGPRLVPKLWKTRSSLTWAARAICLIVARAYPISTNSRSADSRIRRRVARACSSRTGE